MSKYSKEDVNANWINKRIHLAEEYSLRCINIIENETNTDIDKLEYRDVYYDIINLLNSDESIGHAICLVGLRRTGKSVLLNQIKMSSSKYNIAKDEILHLSLFTLIDDSTVDRNNLDISKIDNGKEIKYPYLADIKSLIEKVMSYSKIKLVIIDEVTLCEDLILCGKGLLDWMFNNGIKVLLAGTESASLLLANDNSLYTRAILKDVSYISFGEYCRLKRIKLSTYKEKRSALDRYIKYGNILDDTIEIDEKYIQSAVGVNLALSIINSDNAKFIEFDNNIKGLVQNIIKYFKLLGEKINLSAINSDISRANISNAIKNVNKRRENDKLSISKSTKNQLAITSAEQFFKNYSLKLTKSTIPLMSQHLDDIDSIFNNMGMIYSLTKVPYATINNAMEADDIHLLHGLLYNLGDKLAEDFKISNLKLSDTDILDVYNNIKNTVYGNILENIVVLHYIKMHEASAKLQKQITSYGEFSAERYGTRFFMYKYREKIVVDNEPTTAEVDIVRVLDNCIELIEIKRSDVIDEHQVRWILNKDVHNRIQEIVGMKEIVTKVYYLGKPTIYNGVQYENITDVLLSDYKLKI